MSMDPILRPSESFCASAARISLAFGARLPRRDFDSASIFFMSAALFCGITSVQGARVTSSRGSVRRWVPGSKLERESISSPQNSTRTGSGSLGEKKSTIPPRRLNWPGPSIWASRV